MMHDPIDQPMNLRVRQAEESDWPGIREVITGAFGDGPGPGIAKLAADLLEDKSAAPRLSLVALDGDVIAGHILFTKVGIRNSPREFSASILAPLAVRTEHQGKGVGGELIAEGINRLRASGIELVFVLGHPGYYPKHGFSPAGAQGLEAPYPIPPKDSDAWMVQDLHSGAIENASGRVTCAKALMDPKHWRE